jgi:hypothetical protein
MVVGLRELEWGRARVAGIRDADDVAPALVAARRRCGGWRGARDCAAGYLRG